MQPRGILITGASRGLGRALALAYAAPSKRLALAARHAQDLERVARTCEARGANVLIAAFDVRDVEATRAFVGAAEEKGPIDLAIVNAGQFSGNGPGTTFEPLESALNQISANLQGAIVTVDAVLPAMRRRGRGQIALVSSLAALHPLADAAAYSASKAGLSAFGAAVREFLAGERIEICLVHPGHIRTAQTDIHVGRLPLIMEPETAADTIVRGLERGKSDIAFPRRLVWLIRASRMLPWRLRARLGRAQRFHVQEDRTGG